MAYVNDIIQLILPSGRITPATIRERKADGSVIVETNDKRTFKAECVPAYQAREAVA